MIRWQNVTEVRQASGPLLLSPLVSTLLWPIVRRVFEPLDRRTFDLTHRTVEP
jgi:hypothetical protein